MSKCKRTTEEEDRSVDNGRRLVVVGVVVESDLALRIRNSASSETLNMSDIRGYHQQPKGIPANVQLYKNK